jgi:hypothetical protein
MSSADWIGTIGVTILLLAFALNLLNIISAGSYSYLAMNGIGALLAGIASVMINYVPFVILEAVWVIVSLFGIIRKLMVSPEQK